MIRHDTFAVVDVDEVRAFLADNHRAVLATIRRDGRPQLSPVACALSADGQAVEVSTRETSMKVKNLRREPFAALCLLNDRFFGAWAQVEGTATIVSLPEAMEPLVDLYRRLAGEHPDWDDYRAAMVADRRLVVRLRADHIYGWRPA
jgi:PPOX class probable F420-dependent enzyme